MITVQLPDAATNDSQTAMHTSMINIDTSLESGIQKYLSEPTHAHELFDQ